MGKVRLGTLPDLALSCGRLASTTLETFILVEHCHECRAVLFPPKFGGSALMSVGDRTEASTVQTPFCSRDIGWRCISARAEHAEYRCQPQTYEGK